jgi:hypothetical protein
MLENPHRIAARNKLLAATWSAFAPKFQRKSTQKGYSGKRKEGYGREDVLICLASLVCWVGTDALSDNDGCL